MKKVLLLLFLVLAVMGCTQREPTKEILMYQKLQAIGEADKKGKPIVKMDSLILQLIDYYENSGSKLKLAEAYYDAGRIYSERQETHDALIYYQKAIDALSESDNPSLKGSVYSQMGQLLTTQKLYEEAIDAYKKSCDYSMTVGDTLEIACRLRDIAAGYRQIGDYKHCRQHLEKAMRYVKPKKSAESLYYELKVELADLFFLKKDTLRAFTELKTAISHDDIQKQTAFYDIVSKIYMGYGLIEQAESYSRRLLKTGTLYTKCAANERLAKIYILRDQPKQALSYLLEYKRLNDSINSITNTENIAKIHAMYNYQKREQENVKLREENRQKNLYLTVAAILLVVLCLVCVFGVLLYRKHKVTLWLKSELLEGIKQQQPTEDELMAGDKQKRLQATDISKHIFQLLDSPLESKKRLSEEDWIVLDQTVNAVCPRFSERLKGLSGLNDYELQVCLLRKIGVPPTKIALLLHKSKQAINSTRERLYYKAFGQKGTPSLWDDFLQTL